MAEEKFIPNKTSVSDSGGQLTVTISFDDNEAISPFTWMLDSVTPFLAETDVVLLYEE